MANEPRSVLLGGVTIIDGRVYATPSGERLLAAITETRVEFAVRDEAVGLGGVTVWRYVLEGDQVIDNIARQPCWSVAELSLTNEPSWEPPIHP